MYELTYSLRNWLWQNHREILPLVMLGHGELFTDEMSAEYLEWCSTPAGRRYLAGGDLYEEHQRAERERNGD